MKQCVKKKGSYKDYLKAVMSHSGAAPEQLSQEIKIDSEDTKKILS